MTEKTVLVNEGVVTKSVDVAVQSNTTSSDVNFLITLFVIIVSIALIAVVCSWWESLQSARKLKNEKNAYRPSAIVEKKFRKKYPGITMQELELVWSALVSYFDAIALSHKQSQSSGVYINVGMPSLIVDDLWHEMILDTKNYIAFCDKFYGMYLHHHPGDIEFKTNFSEEKVVPIQYANTYALLNKMRGTSFVNDLPLLLAIDEIVGLKNGFRFNARSLSVVTVDDHRTMMDKTSDWFYKLIENTFFGSEKDSGKIVG